jgi:hypothetical protein
MSESYILIGEAAAKAALVEGVKPLCDRIEELEAENARLKQAMNRLLGSMEGVDTPFTDEQEAAYEAAASLLDSLLPDPACPLPHTDRRETRWLRWSRTTKILSPASGTSGSILGCRAP